MKIAFVWSQGGRKIAEGNLSTDQPGIQELIAPERNAQLELIIPLCHVKGLWTPEVNRNVLQRISWAGKLDAAPFSKPSVVAFVDGFLRNCFALHALPVENETRISWQINQCDGVYIVHVEWREAMEELPRVHCFTELLPVDRAVEILMKAGVQAASNLPSPAFEPSYCTWYAFHGSLEQTRVEAYAKKARELGFGSFILDDGWEYDQPQRISGTLGKWHSYHGDYEPSPVKFPRFKEFFEYLESLSLRRILWVATYIFGESTRAFQTLRPHLFPSWLDEGFLIANPKAEAVQEFLKDRLCFLASHYAIDGFKSDYDYALYGPEMKSYGFGRAYSEGLTDLVAAIRKIKPDFEWILSPGTFGPQITNVFRCQDVPYDPETNRLALAHFKPLVGGAAMHYDPSLWRSDDSLATVYRHMIPSIFCIPSLGADILALPETHLDAIRGTLVFYRRHQEILNAGSFVPVWAGGDYQSFHAQSGGREVAATFSNYPVTMRKTGKSWLVNAGFENRVTLSLSSGARVVLETLEGRSLAGEICLKPGSHEIICEPGAVLALEME